MERSAHHISVLADEVLRLLQPSGRDVIVDCTIGLGGHSEMLLEAAGPAASLIGIDADEENLRIARERLSRFGSRVRLFHANFSQLEEVFRQASLSKADKILADLGVCSVQIDDSRRGFSFQVDGPLDMRLDRSSGPTAADLVNSLSEAELADVIYKYGQERFSRRIARIIFSARRQHKIETTGKLAEIVCSAIPAAARQTRRGVHPATRTFQALRIAVNDEMGSLEKLLEFLPLAMVCGGRAAIISFHSLEDGCVKRSFAALAKAGNAVLLAKKPITPTEREIAANPRSRSAKLRAIQWNV